MTDAIISGEYPEYGERLKQLGYHVIYTELLPALLPYERYHADLQCLIIDDTAFVLKECRHLAQQLSRKYKIVLTDEAVDGKYPSNVHLNAAIVGKNVIANTRSLDKKVVAHCERQGYHLIHFNQGYAKCSCAVIADNALITADNGINNSLSEYKIDVLKIRQGRVALDGADYGFIGGASGLDITNGKRTIFFTGDIKTHPDCLRIKAFCQKHDTAIISLTENILTDIGSLLFC